MVGADGDSATGKHLWTDGNCLGCLNRPHMDHKEQVKNNQRRRLPGDNYMVQMKETEELLAADLANLSVKDRLKAMDDVHCVAEEEIEDPKAIENALREFNLLVQKEKNLTYELAASQSKQYAENAAFRLIFLRAKLYDVKSAVHQMFRFLEQKALYFGEDTLGRDIIISDLNEDDLEALFSGSFHFQNEKDRSGRFIVYCLHEEEATFLVITHQCFQF